MQILRKQKPPIPHRFIYLATVLISLVIVLQFASTNAQGQFVIRLNYIVLFIIKYFIWALLIDFIYGMGNLLDKAVLKDYKIAFALLCNTLLLISLHFLISNFVYYIVVISFGDVNPECILPTVYRILPEALLSRTVDLFAILLILKIIDAYRVSKNRKMQIANLEGQLHLAQLRSLRAQLNPHFLFNSLHAVQTLIGYDDVKAKAMVIKISNLLRKMLDQEDRQLISLEEELSYLKDYLDIEQERFHDRLSIILDIDEATKPMLVPPLLLQPLAENAIKHGISLLERHGEISLVTTAKDNGLQIEMSNTIPLEPKETPVSSTKLGLRNIKNRLSQLFKEDYTLSFDKSPGVFKLTLTIKNISKL